MELKVGHSDSDYDGLFEYNSKIAKNYEEYVFFRELRRRGKRWKQLSRECVLFALLYFTTVLASVIALATPGKEPIVWQVIINIALFAAIFYFIIGGIKLLAQARAQNNLALYYEVFSLQMYTLYQEVELYPAEFELAVDARGMDLSMYKFER